MTPAARWVAWPVPPGTRPYTRPWLLHQELRRDVLANVDHYYHHGSTPGNAEGTLRQVGLGALARGQLPERASGVVLSPVLLRALGNQASWIDLYDDWSLAPDVNPAFRLMAAAGYAGLRRRSASQLVTVNSRYMQLKLGRRRTLVVPNGVDPALAALEHEGDDRRRLIIMGNFHRGRTDYALLTTALQCDAVAEVVVVGAQVGSRAESIVLAASRNSPAAVRLMARTPMPQLAALIGPNTMALIPHVVSDYTLSQDLMKVYQFLALGVPTLAPRALWPTALPLDHGHLLEVGLDLDEVVRFALRRPVPTPSFRRDLALDHSWSRRADLIRTEWPDGP